MPKEQLLYPARIYSAEELDNIPEPGQIHRVFAGAPGIGHHDYYISRRDEQGIWGWSIENTIRELQPWETI